MGKSHIPAFFVPAHVGQHDLRCTPTDVVTLTALRALATHTSDCFDEDSHRWFGTRLREVTSLLSLTTKAGARWRIRWLEGAGQFAFGG